MKPYWCQQATRSCSLPECACTGFDGLLNPRRNAIVPPSPETWQSTEPVDRWTRNTRGFERAEERVPDFDALTDEAIRSAGVKTGGVDACL